MKRITIFVSVLLLSLSSLFVLATPRVFAATRTWDGGGSDNNLSTAANWSGDVAPTAGDDLVFPANMPRLDITNDFTAATSFNSLTFSGTASQDSDYTLSGNSMTLVDGVTHTMTGSFAINATIALPLILNGTQTFNAGSSAVDVTGTLNLGSSALTFNTGASLSKIDGVISGTGSITKTGTGVLDLAGDNTYSGATTVSAGQILGRQANALGTAAGATTVASGAGLLFVKATGDFTVAEPMTLNGTGVDDFNPTLGLSTTYGFGGGIVVPFPLTTFSGAITLGSNITVSAGNRNGKLTGALSGNYTISILDSSSGTFEIASSANTSGTPNKVLAPPVKETKYEANSPSTSITVNTNETAIVTGTYGDVSVNLGGTLKGTGTVGTVNLYGKIAPGLSPGCLNTGDLTFATTASYDFEIAGATVCTQYDQIRTTGSVALDGTLNVLLLNNFKPVTGQKYVLISNDGTDSVTGTFAGLAQGATVTVGTTTFSISYTGGDGNDVELTVTGGAPVTGFSLLQNNPLIAAGIMTVAGFGIILIARRTKFARRR